MDKRLSQLIKLAQSYPENNLRSLLTGAETGEEVTAKRVAEEAVADRERSWAQLSETLGREKIDPEQRSRLVRFDPRWNQAEQKAEHALAEVRKKKEYWDEARSQVRASLKECVETCGGSLPFFSLEGLYEAARDEGLDNRQEPEYNKAMGKSLYIPRFKVFMQEGTASLKLERALEPITEEMNRTPLRVNLHTWKKNKANLEDDAQEKTERVCKTAGRNLRPNSPEDVASFLFEDLGLPVQRVNKPSGKPSTDEETLQALYAMGHAIAGEMLEARKALSCLSQIRAWEPYAWAGFVQTKWNQYGQPHGRYTSEDPNLHSRILEIRETIEAASGYQFISCDLGQAEYVTWASLSQDPVLGKAFLEGTDFHEQMYKEVQKEAPDVDLRETTPRQAGKALNFALLYLMQAFVLARKLGVDLTQAQTLLNGYAARAPVAIKYRDDYLVECQKTGWTSTYFGRQRHMPEITTAKGAALHQANKTAWHHHVAGTAAELLKVKQVKTWNGLRKAGIPFEKAQIALNMYDEVIVMAHDSVVDEVKEIMRAKFLETTKNFLPFAIDIRTGPNWLTISK